jgi:hypothetical protein
MSDLLKERVIHAISTQELERRWKAVREVMKAKKVDFLLIQNNNDYLGGYVKWFTDMPAVHAYPVAVIFPVAASRKDIAPSRPPVASNVPSGE